MATVFLSYAHEDAARARSIAAALEKDGHTVWWDQHVPGGHQFTKAIQDALDAADAVVVAWSNAAVNSPWVRDEAAYGRDRGALVPVTLDGSQPPLGFREFQTIDLSPWNGRKGSRLLKPLRAALAARSAEAKAETSTNSVPRIDARQHSLSRRWVLPALGVLALLIAGLVAAAMGAKRSDRPQDTPSIAVLPFTDLSPGRDKAYFAEGVAEEILSALAGETDIKVLGRTSTRQIERDADPKSLRQRLGLTHLLEGSARSAGDQLRVNVRLIDTSDGRQVWEEEYQGRPVDVFAVQDQIAGAVVQRLRGTLFRRAVRAALPTDAESYQAYLQARALMRTRTEKSLREALALASKVIERDRGYAPAHALVAELYYLLSDDYASYGSMPVEQARKRALPHAREAIRLAPASSEGYAALGLISSGAAAVEPLERAIQMDPSRAELRLWLGFTLNELGQHDAALAQYRAAAEIDPLGFAPVTRLVHALAAAGRVRDATETVQRFVARGGEEALRYPMLLEIANWQADPSAVIAYGEAGRARQVMRSDYFLLFMAAALNTLGEGRRAAAILPPTLRHFHAPYYSGELQRLHRNISKAGAEIWKAKDGTLAISYLARTRDWPAIARLYDSRNFNFSVFCERWADQSPPIALALRAEGRSREAGQVMDCLRRRLAIELRNQARLPEEWPGDLEFRRASYAAIANDRSGAVRWLERAIARGWLGQPFSSRLVDYPQFDGLTADPRLQALQNRIEGKIRHERAELALKG